LTSKTPFSEDSISLYKKVGSLLLISTLFSIFGLIWLYVGADSLYASNKVIGLSVFSSFTMVTLFGAYFYLLNKYPVYQVIPLFQLTSLWLILIEFVFGGSVSVLGILGILLLVIGAYLIDVGEMKWKIPSSLLGIMAIVSLIYACGVYSVRIASEISNAWITSFWQYLGIFGIGVLLFLVVKVFRDGFLFRIKKQGKTFLGISSVNESMAQVSYVASNYSIATAPVSAYASALGSIQSVFVLIIFYFFPQKKVIINRIQIFAIFIMVLGGIVLQVIS
jgi:drug/metabolite transporter (DMT)-like permease